MGMPLKPNLLEYFCYYLPPLVPMACAWAEHHDTGSNLHYVNLFVLRSPRVGRVPQRVRTRVRHTPLNAGRTFKFLHAALF